MAKWKDLKMSITQVDVQLAYTCQISATNPLGTAKSTYEDLHLEPVFSEKTGKVLATNQV